MKNKHTHSSKNRPKRSSDYSLQLVLPKTVSVYAVRPCLCTVHSIYICAMFKVFVSKNIFLKPNQEANNSKNPSLNDIKRSSSILFLSVVQCFCAAGDRETQRRHKASTFCIFHMMRKTCNMTIEKRSGITH